MYICNIRNTIYATHTHTQHTYKQIQYKHTKPQIDVQKDTPTNIHTTPPHYTTPNIHTQSLQ